MHRPFSCLLVNRVCDEKNGRFRQLIKKKRGHCYRNHDELFRRQAELRYGQFWLANTETQLSLERIIKTRKNKRIKNSSCEPYADFNSPKCPSATLERPEYFLATTRTLQCFTSKLGHRGRAPTSAANHKDVRGKSQRDRHPRCQPRASPTALTNWYEKPVFGQGLNSAVLHYPSKTFSFIILDPSRWSNLGPLDLEKKSTSRRFFQIGPRTNRDRSRCRCVG